MPEFVSHIYGEYEMADIDRDFPGRNKVDRHETYVVERSGSMAGWWIAGLLVLAVLIIGFMAMSGGNPTPVEPASTTVESQPAPAEPGVVPAEPAPVEDAAPAAEPAPADAAPADAAPAEAEPAPIEPAPGG